MSNNHWFVEAMSELVEDARRQKTANVLPGLRTALEVFCVEADLTDEDAETARNLFEIDTTKDVNSEARCCGVYTPVNHIN